MTELKFQRILWYILIIAGSYCLIGCSKKIYIPVESVKTEYETLHVRDSIYLKDSVYIHEKGDTVFIDRWRTIYKEKLIRDSINIRDSIPYMVEIEKNVIVYKMNKIQNFFYVLGLIFCAILIGKYGIKYIKRFK